MKEVATPKLPPPPRSAQKRSGVRFRVDLQHFPVGSDELDAEHVVGGEAVLGHQPAEAAAERVTGDPRRGDGAARYGQPVRGCSVVQLGPKHAPFGGGSPLVGIDVDPFHLSEVDHHSAVRHCSSGDVVPAAPDRDLEPFATRQSEGRHHVARLPAAHDHGRSAVDEAVVYRAGRVVTGVLRAEHRP